MDNYIIGLLRASAAEIAESNICGWGNTMADAADEIESLRATISRLREYANHRSNCSFHLWDSDAMTFLHCDCGYDALMAEAGEGK